MAPAAKRVLPLQLASTPAVQRPQSGPQPGTSSPRERVSSREGCVHRARALADAGGPRQLRLTVWRDQPTPTPDWADWRIDQAGRQRARARADVPARRDRDSRTMTAALGPRARAPRPSGALAPPLGASKPQWPPPVKHRACLPVPNAPPCRMILRRHPEHVSARHRRMTRGSAAARWRSGVDA